MLLIRLADRTPEPEDVTAGGWGGLMFVLLIVAVALLMLSFLKQMRKTEQARREGVFGDAPDGPETPVDHVDDHLDDHRDDHRLDDRRDD